MYIPKYNLFGLYNVAHVYAFRVAHWVSDSQFVCFSLEKTFLLFLDSQTWLSSLWKSEALWASPHQFNMPTVVIMFSSCLGSHVAETLWVQL